MEQGGRTGRIHRLAESNDKHALRRRGRRRILRLANSSHMVRDGDAFAYVLDNLSHALGLRYGGVVVNFPREMFADQRAPVNGGFLSSLRASDLVVRTTRPTVPYLEPDTHYSFGRSETPLEMALARADSEFFYYCNRQEVLLQDAVAKELGAGDPFKRIEFRKHGGGRRKGKGGGDFIGYVTFVPAGVYGLPASALNVFSIDGTSTLIWAFIVTQALSSTLAEVVSSAEPVLLIGKFQVEFPDHQVERLEEIGVTSFSIERWLTLPAPIEPLLRSA